MLARGRRRLDSGSLSLRNCVIFNADELPLEQMKSRKASPWGGRKVVYGGLRDWISQFTSCQLSATYAY